MTTSECSHFPKKATKAKSDKCQECGQAFSIRVCLTCGHVGCCEDSPGQHAQKHSKKTGHQVIMSYPADKEGAFTWCYADSDYLTQK